MSDKWKDVTSILQFGLESQKNIADLNKVTSEIIKKRDYDEVVGCVQELMNVAKEESRLPLVEKERRLDKLQEKFEKYRIELAMEGKLLRELRATNDAYASKIDAEIKEAEEYRKKVLPTEGRNGDVRARNDLLKKRLYELMTSRTVAQNFSAQIKLSEENCTTISARICNVAVTTLPLLRGRISMETGKTVIAKTQEMLRANLKGMKEVRDNS